MSPKYFDFFKTFVSFLILLSFGSVFAFVYPRIYDILLLVFVLLLNILNNGKLKLKDLFVISIIFILLFIHGLLTSSSLEGYIGIYIKLILVLLYISAFNHDYTSINNHINNSINITLLLGVLNFLIVNNFSELLSPLQIENTHIRSFYYIFNSGTETNHFGINLYRNQGLFTEPGIFQFFINLKIYNQIVIKQKTLYSSIFPIILLFTTFSTTGFILLFITLAIRFKKILIFNYSIFGGIKFVSFLAFFILFINILITEVEYKFKGDARASSIARSYDLLMGVELIKKYPLIGIGYNQTYNEEIDKLSVKINDIYISEKRGNSNGLIIIFVYFGTLIGSIILFLIYKQRIFANKIIFWFMFCIFLSTEQLFISHFTFLIICSAIFYNYKVSISEENSTILSHK